MNAAMNKKQLMKNCQGLSVGVEKFSRVHNNNVAAANNPTTVGRRVVKTLSTVLVCIYFMNILLMRIISISEGKTNAKVAVALPNTARGIENPAFFTAV